MSLLSTRNYYKPFDHPWMFDYYQQQNQMMWLPEDVPLHNDVKDWQDMSSEEKHISQNLACMFLAPVTNDVFLASQFFLGG